MIDNPLKYGKNVVPTTTSTSTIRKCKVSMLDPDLTSKLLQSGHWP